MQFSRDCTDMSTTIDITTQLATETCCNCGMLFAMPSEVQRKRREDGGYFHCPSGHSQHYTKSEVQKLKEQLDAAQKEASAAKTREQAERDQRWAAEIERDKTKRAFNRAKKRSAAGVCPCCTRSFGNVKRHLVTKHPEFAEKFIAQTDKLKEKADRKTKA